MKHYVYKRNKDGIHYLDLAKSWEKIMIAARIIAAVQAKSKADVLVSHPYPSKTACAHKTERARCF
jgi:small subunit ribosomal protein SAe